MVDSVAIRIGQTDQLDTKLALVRRIYDERPDIGAEVESIDLRFPEAPACKPRGSAARGREHRRSTDSAQPAEEPVGAGSVALSEITGHPERNSSGPSDTDSQTPAPHIRRGKSRRSTRSLQQDADERPDEPDVRR